MRKKRIKYVNVLKSVKTKKDLKNVLKYLCIGSYEFVLIYSHSDDVDEIEKHIWYEFYTLGNFGINLRFIRKNFKTILTELYIEGVTIKRIQNGLIFSSIKSNTEYLHILLTKLRRKQ